MTKADAGYCQAAPGSRRCDRCTMFIRPQAVANQSPTHGTGACTLVSGSIKAYDVCDHFSPTYALKPQGQQR